MEEEPLVGALAAAHLRVLAPAGLLLGYLACPADLAPPRLARLAGVAAAAPAAAAALAGFVYGGGAVAAEGRAAVAAGAAAGGGGLAALALALRAPLAPPAAALLLDAVAAVASAAAVLAVFRLHHRRRARAEAMPPDYEHADGGRYAGEWSAWGLADPAGGALPAKHGLGVYAYPNGDVYKGQWLQDRKQGSGVYYFAAGGFYAGEVSRSRCVDADVARTDGPRVAAADGNTTACCAPAAVG